MSDRNWEDLVERQIREAQESGAFDNLRGRGQKLDPAQTNADESSEEMVNRIVKNEGFAPAWVELDQTITRELAQARQALARSQDWRQRALLAPGADVDWVQGEWRRAVRVFEARIEEINRLILTYNLQLPRTLVNRQRFKVRLDEELQRIGR